MSACTFATPIKPPLSDWSGFLTARALADVDVDYASQLSAELRNCSWRRGHSSRLASTHDGFTFS